MFINIQSLSIGIILLVIVIIIVIVSNLMTCTPGYYANTFAPASTFGHPASTFGFFNQVIQVMLMRMMETKMMSIIFAMQGHLQFHNHKMIMTLISMQNII